MLEILMLQSREQQAARKGWRKKNGLCRDSLFEMKFRLACLPEQAVLVLRSKANNPLYLMCE